MKATSNNGQFLKNSRRTLVVHSWELLVRWKEMRMGVWYRRVSKSWMTRDVEEGRRVGFFGGSTSELITSKVSSLGMD